MEWSAAWVELQVRVASGRIGRLSLGKADKLGRQLRKGD